MAGEIIVAHGMWEAIRSSKQYVPHSVGVYGASMTGKTTLDRQLTTQGEVRPLGEDDRTHHRQKSRDAYSILLLKGLGIRRFFFQRKYMPRRIIILMNKADLWLDEEGFELWEKGFIVRHSVFDVFRQSLYELQEANIPVRVDACSASIGWNVDDAIFRGLMDL